MGGSSKGVYKHLASEDWASHISRLRTWDWDGPVTSAPATHPMTQEGYTAVTLFVDKRALLHLLFVCVNNNMKTNLVPLSLQVKNKSQDEVQFASLFLSLVWSQTTRIIIVHIQSCYTIPLITQTSGTYQ
jgi:hypothetical protein